MSEEEPRNAMEGRARRRASPGTRSKAAVRPVQAEMPPPTKTHVPGTRVPVVYYLCRNRQLEHPHFMEVPLASPQGLYLRDVVSRLDALRGKGMAAMYSWSYKRSYKNGFVWHDLSEDDLLLPAQGSEYVLKGSELLDQPPPASDHQQNTSTNNAKVQCHKPRSSSSSPSPPPAAAAVSVIKEEAPQTQQQPALPSSASSSTLGDDEQCRTPQSGSSGSSSPKTTRGSMSSSGASSPSLTAHNVRSPVAAHDVGAQIDEKGRDLQNNDTTTCTDNEVKLQQGRDAASTQQASPTKRKGPEIVEEDDPAAGAGGSCSSGRDRSGTLESLIREEAGRRGGARILEEEDDEVHKLKPGNLLMRLIACGSMSVKNHPGFGLVQSYKPRFTQLEFPSSPVLSPLGALRHPDHSPGSPPTNTGAVRVSETERSSGSLHDTAGTGKQEESGKGTTPNLKRSSSYNQDGVSEEERSKGGSVRLASIKCCPEAIKMAPCEQPRSGSTLVCTTTDASHNSGEQQECSSGPSPQTLSRRTNKRTSDPSSGKIRSSRVVTFHDEKEKVIKIEERLSSGARVVIQCAPLL